MKVALLRRKKLGKTSCREISGLSQHDVLVHRADRGDCPNVDVVIRWGCTANVPCNRVINRAEAIHLVNDKREFRRLLNEHGLCPTTWTSTVDFNYDGQIMGDRFMFPCVVRPTRHSQGRNLHVCCTFAEVQRVCNGYGEGGYYISRLINKVAEYRVFVVQGRVACVAEKTPGNPDDVAWNVAQGGRFDNVNWQNWPINVLDVAVKSFSHSGLDFGGVDVIVDHNGGAYCLEINSAPSLTSHYRQRCMAKCFDWMLDRGKEVLPIGDKYKRDLYYNYIHPAISRKAA